MSCIETISQPVLLKLSITTVKTSPDLGRFLISIVNISPRITKLALIELFPSSNETSAEPLSYGIIVMYL